MRCSCENASREARREALEEAAKLCDDLSNRDEIGLQEWAAATALALDIRALKDKPETK